jgi:type IV pilus assembly protein PilQ
MASFKPSPWMLMIAPLVAAQVQLPARADTARIVQVSLQPTESGASLTLRFSNGQRPQIFATARGNSWVADILNTQLALPQGKSFRQVNPAAGITAVEVVQVDAKTARVIVNGATTAPNGVIDQSSDQGFTISLVAGTGNPTAATPIPINPAPGSPSVQRDRPTPLPTNDLLPPLMPRAVAPPLGDISISTNIIKPPTVRTGATRVIPRLSLRNAPAREALALLARAAGLNLVYLDSSRDPSSRDASSQTGLPPGGPPVTLDLQNTPVEDAINYVVRVSGLQISRTGNTLLVGVSLPTSGMNLLTRTLRLNQANAKTASTYLNSLGAGVVVNFDPTTQVPSTGGGTNPITVQSGIPEQKILTPPDIPGVFLPLRGLTVTVDERLNQLTVVGTPEMIETAVNYVTQLDLRKRQVAVNVKVIDVNLDNSQEFNSSFSFGVGDTFFVSDGGSAVVNFGNLRPASSADMNQPGNPFAPPVTGITYPGEAKPFLDNQSGLAPFGTPANPNATGEGASALQGFSSAVNGSNANAVAQQLAQQWSSNSGIRQIFPQFNQLLRFWGVNTNQTGFAAYPQGILPRPNFGTFGNPLQAGIEEIDDGKITYGVPTLLQYPTKFLQRLQAEIVSRNAKILTDPTLVIQEGELQTVKLTEQVVTNIVTQTVTPQGGGTSTTSTTAEKGEVGLTMDVQIDRIDDNGFVTLQLVPKITSFGSEYELTSGIGQRNTLTLLNTREVRSGKIRLRDSQTLILAGVIQDSERQLVKKWPILGDLPIVGALFRGSTTSRQRKEVIIVLTPRVMDDNDTNRFGYGYAPGQEAQQILRRGAL